MRASSASQLGDGAGRPSAASSVATPTHGRPPDTAAAAADAAAALVSASARAPRAVVEHEQATCGPPDPPTTTAHGPDPLRPPGALDGVGRPGAASCVATPTHSRPPDTAAASADAAAALVSASARVPCAVAEHEQTSSALTSYHSGSKSFTALSAPSPPPRGPLHPEGSTRHQPTREPTFPGHTYARVGEPTFPVHTYARVRCRLRIIVVSSPRDARERILKWFQARERTPPTPCIPTHGCGAACASVVSSPQDARERISSGFKPAREPHLPRAYLRTGAVPLAHHRGFKPARCKRAKPHRGFKPTRA